MAHKVDLPSQPWWNRWWGRLVVIIVVLDFGWRVILALFQAPTRPATTVSPPAAAVSRPAAISSDLRCAPDETYVTLPKGVFNGVMPPRGDCWTAWYVRPIGSTAFREDHEGGRITMELAFSNGKFEQRLDVTPMEDYKLPWGNITGIRFKNTGRNTVSIRVETQ